MEGIYQWALQLVSSEYANLMFLGHYKIKKFLVHLVPIALLARTLNWAWEAGGNLRLSLNCFALSQTNCSHSSLHWSHSSSYWVMGEPLSCEAFQRRVSVLLVLLAILGGRGVDGGRAGMVRDDSVPIIQTQ